MATEEQHGDFLLRFADLRGQVHAEAKLDEHRIFDVRADSVDSARKQLLALVSEANPSDLRAAFANADAEKLSARRQQSIDLHATHMKSKGLPYKGWGIFKIDRNPNFPVCWNCKENLDTVAGSYACLACKRHICLGCGACRCGAPDKISNMKA